MKRFQFSPVFSGIYGALSTLFSIEKNSFLPTQKDAIKPVILYQYCINVRWELLLYSLDQRDLATFQIDEFQTLFFDKSRQVK